MNLFSPASIYSLPGRGPGAERTTARPDSVALILLLALGLLAALSTAVVIALSTVSLRAPGSWSNIVDDVALVFALAACIHASRRTVGDTRLMWRLLTAAVLCWVVGEAVFDIRILGFGLDPANSASYVFYMAFYPLMIAGLIIRDRGARERGFDIRTVDAVVVALAVAVVAYGLVFNNPLSADAQSIGTLGKIAYPLLDGLLIWSITYQLSSRMIIWDTTRTLLACAVFCIFATGVLWSMVGSLASGAATALAMTFIGFAALASPAQTRIRTATEHKRQSVVPEVVLFVAYVGVIAVLGSRFYAFDPALTILAGFAMLVVVSRLILAFAQNERLLEQSELRGATDSLTGLSNLQYFRERLDSEISRTEREGGSFALLMIDIDYFKSVNDIAGHRAGDRVLIEVAATMRQTFRPFDVVCRIGGDELAVIAPHAGPNESLQMARRLCDAVTEITITEFADLPPVSVSVGCAVFPTLGASATDLIDNADEALYRVKQHERGGAELYAADAPQPADERWQLARVRAQLAARDADFQAVFRHAREAMGIIDGKGTILLVNDRAVDLFGASREQMVGHRASEFVAEGTEFERLLPQMSSDGELEGTVELQLDHADKSMTIEYSAARFSPDRFLTILWDVTARDREAAALVESERRFRAVFESSLDPIFVTDNGGFVRDANPAAAEMAGRALDELIGKRVDELVHPEEMSEVIDHVDALRDLKTTRGTFRTRDRDGILRTVEYSAVADFIPGLHLTNVREVTEQHLSASHKPAA